MMKQTFFSILLSLNYVLLTAQITVTSSTFPAVGDKLRYAQASNPNIAIALFTPPGGSQTWDLSALKPARTFEVSYRPATEGGNVAAYPGANMVVIEGLTEKYYKSSTSKFELLGQASATYAGVNLKTVILNQPPFVERRSPLNFFDINAQSSSVLYPFSFKELPVGTLNLPVTPDSLRFRIARNTTEVTDAWGTITLPGTLPQAQYPALRVKKTVYTESRIDGKVPLLGWIDITDVVIKAAGNWSNILGVDTTVTFNYYNNKEKEEIAVLTFNNAINQVISVVYKNTAASTPVETINATADIQIFPNPARESTTIRFAQPIATDLNFRISNPLGQVFKTGVLSPEHISNGYLLDCRTLPNGLYIFEYNSKTWKGSQRLMINH